MRIAMLKKLFTRLYMRHHDQQEIWDFAQQQLWKNERTVEYRFVLEQLIGRTPCTILDVGTGKTALPALLANCGNRVMAIDNVRDYWQNGMMNRHFPVLDENISWVCT